MFQVIKKNTLETTNVYDIRNDKNGYPQFLIYKDTQWRWVSAKYFRPIGAGLKISKKGK